MSKSVDSTWLCKSSALQASALLATCILFIVEFQFETARSIHLIALCLLSFSIPLFAPIVISMYWLNTGVYGKEGRKFSILFKAKNLGSLLVVIAIGLIIWSIHYFAGILFFVSILFAVYLLISSTNACPTIAKPKNLNQPK